MNRSRPVDPRRIRRLSRLLAISCLLLIVALPIAVAVYWASADATSLAVRANLPANAIQGSLLAWQRGVGALITGVPLALLMLGLWEARKCFKLFAVGRIFTAEAVRCLSRFAGWATAAVVAGIVADTATSVLLTLNNPPGTRSLAVSFGSDQILMLLFSGMVWLMAAVISQGQALAEENATFI
ncbi:MAG: DUF2975 domain-containing protein [Proteobacteria bacterium]|nr:DUF2975 domain-containing protein [Pseudomonadota bacterium]